MAAARRAIVMVWDGMRPDFIRPELTPNLWRLAGEGVRFSDSHSIFPTVTRCNSACIGSGCLPASHGIPNNTFYLPSIEPSRPLNSGDNLDLDKLRGQRGGRILTAPTLAEVVKAGGGKTVVAGTGSPGSSLLLHPEAAACGDVILNPGLFEGVSRAEIERRFGPLPERRLPRSATNAYFTRVITELVLPAMAPDLLYFWHTDPDATVHARGVGHADSLSAIRDADTNLGALLAALDRLGLGAETDIVVTSDHGFSTVSGSLDVPAALVAAGLKDSKDSVDVVVTGGFIYVAPDHRDRVPEILRSLLRLEGVGALFARDGVHQGALPMSELGPVTPLSPDVIYSPDWDDAVDIFGVPGTVRGGEGSLANHGSLSRWEVRNTLVAAGPGIRSGSLSDIPASTVDIAPTLAHLLGLTLAADGRVLSEALEDGDAPAVTRRTVEAQRDGFRQSLDLANVGAARYVDSARRLR